MPKLLDQIRECSQDTLSSGSISGYAARAAAKELIQAWKSHLDDGADPSIIAGDISDTINELKTWKLDMISRGVIPASTKISTDIIDI